MQHWKRVVVCAIILLIAATAISAADPKPKRTPARVVGAQPVKPTVAAATTAAATDSDESTTDAKPAAAAAAAAVPAAAEDADEVAAAAAEKASAAAEKAAEAESSESGGGDGDAEAEAKAKAAKLKAIAKKLKAERDELRRLKQKEARAKAKEEHVKFMKERAAARAEIERKRAAEAAVDVKFTAPAANATDAAAEADEPVMPPALTAPAAPVFIPLAPGKPSAAIAAIREALQERMRQQRATPVVPPRAPGVKPPAAGASPAAAPTAAATTGAAAAAEAAEDDKNDSDDVDAVEAKAAAADATPSPAAVVPSLPATPPTGTFSPNVRRTSDGGRGTTVVISTPGSNIASPALSIGTGLGGLPPAASKTGDEEDEDETNAAVGVGAGLTGGAVPSVPPLLARPGTVPARPTTSTSVSESKPTRSTIVDGVAGRYAVSATPPGVAAGQPGGITVRRMRPTTRIAVEAAAAADEAGTFGLAVGTDNETRNVIYEDRSQAGWHFDAMAVATDKNHDSLPKLNDETVTFHVTTTDPSFGASTGTTPLVLNKPMVYTTARGICEVRLGAAWSSGPNMQPIPPLIVTMGLSDEDDTSNIDAVTAMAALDAMNIAAKAAAANRAAPFGAPGPALPPSRALPPPKRPASSSLSVFRHRIPAPPPGSAAAEAMAAAASSPVSDSSDDGPLTPWATSLPFTVHHICHKTGRVVVRVYMKVNRLAAAAASASSIPGTSGSEASAQPFSVVKGRGATGSQQQAKLYHFQYVHDCKVEEKAAAAAGGAKPADGSAAGATPLKPTEAKVSDADDTAANPSSVPLHVGTAELLADVVKHGVTEVEYTVPAAPAAPAAGAAPVTADTPQLFPMLVPHEKNVLSFFFMSGSNPAGKRSPDDLPLRVQQPVVHVTDPSIVGTHASGRIASAMPSLLIPNASPLAYTLTLACRAVGTTLVTVSVSSQIAARDAGRSMNPFLRRMSMGAGGAAAPSNPTIRFAFRKVCTEVSVPEGTGVLGLMVSSTKPVPPSSDSAQAVVAAASAAMGGDVVKDGLTQPLYTSADSRAAEAKTKRLMIPAAEETATFYFELRSDQTQRYGDPIVSADSDSDMPIAFPELSGSLLESNILLGVNSVAGGAVVPPVAPRMRGIRQPKPSPRVQPAPVLGAAKKPIVPLELVVKFNCERAGMSAVTVKVPLLPSGDIRFTVRKECKDSAKTLEATKAANLEKKKKDRASDKKAAEADDEEDEDDDDATKKANDGVESAVRRKVVPDSDRRNHAPTDGSFNPWVGLSVGTSAHPPASPIARSEVDDIVSNGYPTEHYHWDENVHQTALVGTDRPYITVYLSLNSSYLFSVDYGLPTISSQYKTCNPILSGPGASPGVLASYASQLSTMAPSVAAAVSAMSPAAFASAAAAATPAGAAPSTTAASAVSSIGGKTKSVLKSLLGKLFGSSDKPSETTTAEPGAAAAAATTAVVDPATPAPVAADGSDETTSAWALATLVPTAIPLTITFNCQSNGTSLIALSIPMYRPINASSVRDAAIGTATAAAAVAGKTESTSLKARARGFLSGLANSVTGWFKSIGINTGWISTQETRLAAAAAAAAAKGPLHPVHHLTIMFRKECAAKPVNADGETDDNADTEQTAIPGLSIGFSSVSREIVHNGLATPQYVSERSLSLEARSANAYIAANHTVSTLYLSYSSLAQVMKLRSKRWERRRQRQQRARNGGVVPPEPAAADPNSVIEFGEPIVVVRSGLAAPALSGIGADGGKLQKNGDPVELDITYNCAPNKPGTEAVTIKIPILSGLPVPPAPAAIVAPTKPPASSGSDASEDVDASLAAAAAAAASAAAAVTAAAARTHMVQFTLTKVCNGVPHLQGMFVTGLKIATSADLLDASSTSADVLLNGFTKPSYSSHKLTSHNAPRRIAPREEDVTAFIVRYKNRWAESIRGYEPVVVARPPICNPMIEHSFQYLSDVEAEAEKAARKTDREVAVMVADEVAAEAEIAAASSAGASDEIKEAARIARDLADAAQAESTAASTAPTPAMAVENQKSRDESAAAAAKEEEFDPKAALEKHLKEITILISSRIDTMNISYNCVFEGTAIITVTIPLLPRGEVSFSYFKVCQTIGSVQSPHTLDIDQFYPMDGDVPVMINDNVVPYSARDTPYSPPPPDLVIGRPPAYTPPTIDTMTRVHTSLGYINVGTSGDVDSPNSHDVVNLGLAARAYSLPTVAAGANDHLTSAVIHANVLESVFWLSVPARRQSFGKPSLTALPDKDGQTICGPKLTGAAVTGDRSAVSSVDSTPVADADFTVMAARPLDLRIQYNCVRAGISPVLISIPLLPAGSISFRVVKVCTAAPGSEDARRANGGIEYWLTASNGLLIALALVGITVGVVTLRLIARSRRAAVPYAADLSKGSGDAGSLLAGGKKSAAAAGDDDDEPAAPQSSKPPTRAEAEAALAALKTSRS